MSGNVRPIITALNKSWVRTVIPILKGIAADKNSWGRYLAK